MPQYIIRPTSYVSGYNSNLINFGGGAQSSAGITTSLGDNSDLTYVENQNTASRTVRLGLAAPSIPSDEFACRIGSSIRWKGGLNNTYIGVNTYRSTDTPPASTGQINTDSRASFVTTEASLINVGITYNTSNLRIQWFDGRSSGPYVQTADVWATIYTLKKASVTVANQSSSQTYPVIATTTTATIDWEASTADWQNLRKIRTGVQVESGGTGAGTGTIVATGYADTYFTATGSQTVNVTLTTAVPNGTYNVYAQTVRFREDGTASLDTVSAWTTAATLTQSVSAPQQPNLLATWDGTLQRVTLLAPSNLLANGNFETNTTGWTAGANSTLAQSTTVAKFGTGSARLTATASGANSMTTPTGTSGIPVTAGVSYTLYAYTYLAGLRGFSHAILWYNSAGTFLSQSTFATGPLPAGSWSGTAVTGTAPAGAAYAGLSLSITGCSAAELTYFDGVGLYANLTSTQIGAFTSFTDGTTFAGPQTWQIQRSTDQITWTDVRGGSAANSTAANTVPATLTLYDYETNRNSVAYYRIRSSGVISNITYQSNWTQTSVSPTLLNTWNIKVPENAALNFLDASVINRPEENLYEDLGVFRPLDRRYPVIVAGALGGWDGTLTIAIINSTEWNTLKAILESQKVLYLESPFGWSKYIRIVQGTKLELYGTQTTPRRDVSINYVEASVP